ncbi:MAG TPA: hypothetical protein VHO01_16265 [Jatrophihabitans sp.]|nr:hypothetical protein [Jatrophihabitans sp.]
MRQLTRRSLLALGGSAGLLGLAGPAQAAARPTRVAGLGTAAPAIGPRSSFGHLLGRTVLVTGPDGSRRLTLARIADVSQAAAGDENAYNLLFAVPSGPPFTDGIYQLSAPGLRPIPLLLTTIGAPGADQRVQAVVNHNRR